MPARCAAASPRQSGAASSRISCRGQRRAAAQTRHQRLALEVLHGQVGETARLAQVVGAGDVGMAHGVRQGHLLPEAGDVVVLEGALGPERLDRHPALEEQVVGEVDGAHAPFADASGQHVAPAERPIAGRPVEAPRGDRGARRGRRRARRHEQLRHLGRRDRLGGGEPGGVEQHGGRQLGAAGALLLGHGASLIDLPPLSTRFPASARGIPGERL